MSTFSGLLAVSLGAVANGSFSVPLKLCRRKCPDLPDSVFQAYWSLAVGIVSLVTIPMQCVIFSEECFEWQPLGIAGAAACALATACTLVGVRHLGVGLPPSFYAGSFIVAGAIEDVSFLGKSIDGVGLFVLSMILILGSAIGVGMSKVLSARGQSKVQDNNRPEDMLANTSPGVSKPEMLPYTREESVKTNFGLGVGASLAVGIFGSCVPFSGVKAGVSPLGFVASFGVGIILVHLVLCPLLYLVSRSFSSTGARRGQWSSRVAAPYALLSGSLWGLGNVGLSYALTVGVDFALAVSIYQCALVISGLWGVFLFREISGIVPISLFLLCALAIISGIAIESAVVV